nr:MaoC family dehydratase N-terminal domain-containing protein [Paracoccus saliphilus]
MDVDLEHLRHWIGRTEASVEPLTAALAERFLATLDRDGGIEDGQVTPPLIHLCLTQPAARSSELGPDGHPARGGFLPPVPLPNRMWAGGAFRFIAPLRVGSSVTRRSRILDVQLKQGRSGPLCFVTVEHEISCDGALAVVETQDIVYRGSTAAASVTAAPPAPSGAHRRQIEAGATLLFRYSALTFNGHRIHYDRPYATTQEGYPGLVVHGPLQATLLAHLAQDLRGAPPREFWFRSLSPLFDNTGFNLHAVDDGASMSLWTARDGGPVAMQATAFW